MTTPKKGEVWEVRHTRKGNFTAKVQYIDKEWVSLKIVKGSVKMMSADDLSVGDETTARRTLLSFVRKVR